MTDVRSPNENVTKRVPWNNGKIVGTKPPLRPKHVWSIRTKPQVEGRIRDLALFNRRYRQPTTSSEHSSQMKMVDPATSLRSVLLESDRTAMATSNHSWL